MQPGQLTFPHLYGGEKRFRLELRRETRVWSLTPLFPAGPIVNMYSGTGHLSAVEMRCTPLTAPLDGLDGLPTSLCSTQQLERPG